MTRCCGPCNQGRLVCPCPMACADLREPSQWVAASGECRGDAIEPEEDLQPMQALERADWAGFCKGLLFAVMVVLALLLLVAVALLRPETTMVWPWL